MAFKIHPLVQKFGNPALQPTKSPKNYSFYFHKCPQNWFTQISGEQDHSWRGNQKIKPSFFPVKSQPRGSTGPKQGPASISKHAVFTQRTHLACSEPKLRRKRVWCLLGVWAHSCARQTPPGQHQALAHREQSLKENELPWRAHPSKGSWGAQLSFPRPTGTQPTDSAHRELEHKT